MYLGISYKVLKPFIVVTKRKKLSVDRSAGGVNMTPLTMNRVKNCGVIGAKLCLVELIGALRSLLELCRDR